MMRAHLHLVLLCYIAIGMAWVVAWFWRDDYTKGKTGGHLFPSLRAAWDDCVRSIAAMAVRFAGWPYFAWRLFQRQQ